MSSKAAIFSLIPITERSTVASVRIATWLSRTLDIPLYDDGGILTEGALDKLFIVNGSTLYCGHLGELAVAVMKASDVYWVQNDYTLPPPRAESGAKSPFRWVFKKKGLTPHYWSTIERNGWATDKSAYVNWNVLGYCKNAPRAALAAPRALYYGAYRDGRVGAFDSILAAFAGRPLSISSTSAKFPPELLIPPFKINFYEQLGLGFGLGIYIQDERSAEILTSPATRFYEMLSVGLPMVFTPDCIRTLRCYGYDISPYILDRFTVDTLIDNRHKIAEQQQEWVEDFEGDLTKRVRKLYES